MISRLSSARGNGALPCPPYKVNCSTNSPWLARVTTPFSIFLGHTPADPFFLGVVSLSLPGSGRGALLAGGATFSKKDARMPVGARCGERGLHRRRDAGDGIFFFSILGGCARFEQRGKNERPVYVGLTGACLAFPGGRRHADPFLFFVCLPAFVNIRVYECLGTRPYMYGAVFTAYGE